MQACWPRSTISSRGAMRSRNARAMIWAWWRRMNRSSGSCLPNPYSREKRKSDLQIGLMIVGGAVVAAVLIFIWIQDRRFRMQADAAFQMPVADALMQDDARPRAMHERVEPALRGPVLGDEGESETGGPHVRFDADASLAGGDAGVPDEAVPSSNPAAAAPSERRPASPPSVAAPAPYDELIEYRARIGCDGVMAYVFADAFNQARTLGKAIRWLGLPVGVAAWEAVPPWRA